jgi:hypothetical protein
MLDSDFANIKADLDQLQKLWKQHYPHRARGGIDAISGFNFQFLMLLQDAVEAWLAESAFQQRAPSVFTEILSDVLDRSKPDIILLTQANGPRLLPKSAKQIMNIFPSEGAVYRVTSQRLCSPKVPHGSAFPALGRKPVTCP